MTAAPGVQLATAVIDPPRFQAQDRDFREYHITSSCNGSESAVLKGARYWGADSLRRSESSGTPVECTNSEFKCGDVTAVGCNWGRGERILLYLGGVKDQALLAAHEFGHDWYNFADQVGMPPKTVARMPRLHHAAHLLNTWPRRPLADIAEFCGYADQAHFNRDAHKLAGCTLSELRIPHVGHRAPRRAVGAVSW